jgi:hypothetical protein
MTDADQTNRTGGTLHRIAAKRSVQRALWGVGTGVFVVVGWAFLGMTGSDIAYAFATGCAVALVETGIRRWAGSKGVPEWTANEPYITRLRRRYRSRHTTSVAATRDD